MKPLIGIPCHGDLQAGRVQRHAGLQALTVAPGAALIQDMPLQMGDPLLQAALEHEAHG